jgi:hypothetical protein
VLGCQTQPKERVHDRREVRRGTNPTADAPTPTQARRLMLAEPPAVPYMDGHDHAWRPRGVSAAHDGAANKGLTAGVRRES